MRLKEYKYEDSFDSLHLKTRELSIVQAEANVRTEKLLFWCMSFCNPPYN